MNKTATLVRLLFLGGFGFSLFASSPEIPASPTDQLRPFEGASELIFSASGEVVVPAGSQVSGELGSSSVWVSFVTHPTLGLAPEEWPTFEVGSLALVFSRENDRGAISLVSAKGETTLLLEGIGLDPTGRTEQPLSLVAEVLPHSVNLLVQDRVFQFDAPGTAESPGRLVLSAGARVGWSFDEFILSPAHSPSTGAASLGTESGAGKVYDRMALALAALGRSEELLDPSSRSVSAITGTGSTSRESRSQETTGSLARRVSVGLEVFTPSATRVGRSDDVRRAVAAKR
jgi:hypothetical protein